MGTIAHFDVSQINNKYNCKYFVETDTFQGDSVAHALNFDFEKIFSIEINDELANHSKERFKDNPSVEILNASSTDGLNEILNKLDKNRPFWLDAHFPGSDFGVKDYDEEKDHDINMPLLNELKIISSRKEKYQDVTICDDLRLFEEVPDPYRGQGGAQGVNGFDWHMKNLGQTARRESVVHFDLNKELLNLFPDSIIRKDWISEGYLSILPKI